MSTVTRHPRWLWLVLLYALWHPLSASAHGGGRPHLYQVPAGPYQVTVWLSPEPPRVGALQIAVEVDTAHVEAGDIEILISAHPLGQPAAEIRQPAVKQNGFFITYYQSNLALPTAGQWQVIISVHGPSGDGNLQYIIEVAPGQTLLWELIFWSVLCVCALIWAVWIMRN